ncbi:hypothetical protein PUR71_27250 [Streptomyces sp. SP17BM10]|uniref:hypothetical protein n=1 Tax=Streptomyces sp. SP17BM10 TaxID=3002530 RepID=UPI002E789C25|nr:hypothetical protein [Streptomyces sp. SP17BM10]MEE1786570.1 hypothetical protein [Streptomyces sp. SP17BM10]
MASHYAEPRPWGLAACAGASWLVYAVAYLTGHAGADGQTLARWCLAGFSTLIPLGVPGRWGFRVACLVIGWLQFGLELLVSLPWLLAPLPVLVGFFPSGLVLLLAGRKNGGPIGKAIGGLLSLAPIVLFFTVWGGK